MSTSSRTLLKLTGVALIVLGGCNFSSGPSTDAIIRVTTRTTGALPDADGYDVTIKFEASEEVARSGTIGINETRVFDVSEGSYDVLLGGLAPNCSTDDPNPEFASLTEGEDDAVAFDVTCPALPGTLEVTTSTTGDALDQDGYEIFIDGVFDRRIAINQTAAFNDVAPGDYGVELSNVALNCTVGGDNPRDVSVGSAVTTTTTFEVECLPFASDAIAFTTNRDGDFEIYLADDDGANPTNLTNHPATDLGAAIPPDGTIIAFSSDRGGNLDVWVMNADGSNPVQLTTGPGIDFFPVWHPDQNSLVFSSNRTGDFQLWSMDSDGTNLVNLTDVPGSNNQFADFSPDGSQIVFATDRDGNVEIYTMNADGTNPVNLTNHPADDLAPSWSPDGSQILFDSDRGGNRDVFVMNADGSGPTNLTNHPAIDEFANWSPDGLHVAFASTRGGDPDVYVMPATGGPATNITNSPGDDLPGPAQGWR